MKQNSKERNTEIYLADSYQHYTNPNMLQAFQVNGSYESTQTQLQVIELEVHKKQKSIYSSNHS